MEPPPTLDLGLSGSDLSGIDPPEANRMAGLHRRAVAAAALQIPYPVFAVFVIGGSFLGLVDPGSDVVFFGEVLMGFPGLIAFMYWFYGAYGMAQDLSPYPLDTTPGWGVAQFFIPLISLFMPYQRMREIEEVSASGARGTLLDEPARGRVVAGWWAAWILGLVFGGIVGGVDSLSMGETAFAASMLAVAAAVASNVMTALVTLYVDGEQQALAEALWDAEPLAPEAW